MQFPGIANLHCKPSNIIDTFLKVRIHFKMIIFWWKWLQSKFLERLSMTKILIIKKNFFRCSVSAHDKDKKLFWLL